MSRLTYCMFRGVVLALAVLAIGPAAARCNQDEALLKLAAAKANERAGDLQAKLASGSDLEKRFRLDGFTIENNRLKVSGVFLDDPASAPDKKKEDAKDDSSPAQKALEESLRSLVLKTIKDVVKKEADINFTFAFVRIDGTNHPYPNILLQNAFNQAGEKTPLADRVRVDKCRFDGAGRLVLEGKRGQGPEVLAWLTGAIKDKLKDHPATTRTVKGEKQWVEPVDALAAIDWKLTPPKLQEAFTRTNAVRYQRLRVDRIYYAYKPDLVSKPNEAPLFQIVLAGVRLENGKSATQDELIAQCTALWPEQLKDDKNIAYSTKDLTTATVIDVKLTVNLFQKAVAGDKALDGVRIDFALKFGPEGRLIVAGLRPPLASGDRTRGLQEELTRVFHDTMTNSGEKSATEVALNKLGSGPGVSIVELVEADTPDVLNRVRDWAMEKKDDVRLSRLYFDKDGGLRLMCESPYEDNADVGAELNRALAAKNLDFLKKPPTPPATMEMGLEGPVLGLFTIAADDAADKAKVYEPQVVSPTGSFPTYKSLTDVLRTKVAKDVYIERGYFDKNNRYTLRGVVDRDEQNDELERLIAENRHAFQAYFTPLPNRPNLQVISMADLVTRVERVTPAYDDLDGIRVLKADYVFEPDPKDPTKKTQILVFTAHLANAPSGAAADKLKHLAEAKLTELILEDKDHFAKRIPKEGRLVIIEEAPATRSVAPHLQEGDFANGYGALFLARADAAGFVERTAIMTQARAWLDVGILHSPEHASIWFLSAYYYYTIGDMELARRDLRRVCQIEEPIDFDGGFERRRRYLIAKDLQGVKRCELERFWLRTWKEYNDGSKPIAMAASFALTARTFETLRNTKVPPAVLKKLEPLKDQVFLRPELARAIDGVLTPEEIDQYHSQIMNHATMVPGK